MGWKDVTPSDDVGPAGWIGPRLQPFGNVKVGSIIPTGFEAYARIETPNQLAGVLARHTSTPDRCWFCLWDGYGDLHGPPAVAYLYFWKEGEPRTPPPPPPPPPKLRKSRVRLPNRDYLLFTGSVVEGEGWRDGPNLWWPDDRAWIVANEIDLDWYSLIGGTHELCTELIALGARPVTVDDPL
jgi:hypothetical protein